MKLAQFGLLAVSIFLIFLLSLEYLLPDNDSEIESYKNQFIIRELKALMQHADEGDPESQNKIGWMYDQGIGFKEDNKKAFKWYMKSANQGYQKARTNVGVMYELGKGVPKNLEEAEKWYLNIK
tara:strand:+ start:640 stop:1011 length:372 start_codon:yes stop_codon:yes gene_type:complete